MLKDDLLKLISEFEKETWKYKETDELDKDMQYIYKIEHELKTSTDLDIKQIYTRLLSIIGIIRFKHGFEHIIINNVKDLNILKEKINSLSLNSENIEEEYKVIETMYEQYIKTINNVDFIQVQRTHSTEGLYLAVESLKSLIENKNYRAILNDEQIGEVLIDCVKLVNGTVELKGVEKKYKNITQEIWEKTLSNSVSDNSFYLLYSNIVGPLLEQANNLINRPSQSSCSMISSNFIATYLGKYRRIGFIYPKDSKIIMASAYDLGSNVFGEGVKNKELGTALVTPETLEKMGIERAKKSNEDLLSSSCYNEVDVDSKPCGIAIIGFGEKDINVDYEEAIRLANDLKLPLYEIDVLDYKDTLSETDKEYIAYHCILSFMGLNTQGINELAQGNKASNIYRLIDENKEIISQRYLELKKRGNLSKVEIFHYLTEILDISNNNSVKR